MLAFGLFDKIWPQLLSAVWHHVRRTWKTGNPIPQIFRKKAKKKKKTKGILYNLKKIFNSSNDASKQWDGFFCDFYFLATNGIFLWGRKFIKPLLFIPLTSALPQLRLGWQMYIYALGVVRLKGKVTHSVWNPQEKNPFRVREVLNQQPNFGHLLDWLMG